MASEAPASSFARPEGGRLRERVAILNPEVVERCKAQGRSVILLAGHVCNWEWLLLAAGAHLGIPIDVVYKPLRLAA